MNTTNTTNVLKTLLLIITFTAIVPLYSQIDFKEYQLLFEDSFNSGNKPSQAYWMYRVNEKMGGMSVEENVIQGIGDNNTEALIIKFTYNPITKQFKGGGIVSTHNFGYGYYETRAKLYGGKPELAGLHQSFWSMGLTGTNEAEGEGIRDRLIDLDLLPQENRVIEIDGFELDSRNQTLALNYHIYSPKLQSNAPDPRRKEIDINKWFTIGYEWLPDRINFFIDGEYFSTKHLNGIWNVYAPQNVWFTALPVDVPHWGGLQIPPPNASMQVDYFRFYAKSLKGMNRLGNADFEFGDAANEYPIAWIASRTNGKDKNAVKTITDSLQAYSGKIFLALQNKENSKSTVKQIVEFIPNGKYKFSTSIKKDIGKGKFLLKITNGKKVKTVKLKPSTNWEKFTLKNINITCNKAVVEIINQSSNTTLYLDNTSFEEM